MAVVKYTKKLDVVDALQYTGSNKAELEAFAPGTISDGPQGAVVFTPTPGVSFTMATGDWALKDVASAYIYNAGATFELYYKPGGGP